MNTRIALSAENVNKIFRDCLFRKGEDTSKHVKAEGIFNTAGFHPDRLKGHEVDIVAMLDELPEQFHEKTGGGWSFLNACIDKHDNHWGEHVDMERLFQLGIAIGKVKSLTSREKWKTLPGGMPYYVVTA